MRREHGEGDEAAARPHRALWSAGLGLLKVPWAALKCFNGRGHSMSFVPYHNPQILRGGWSGSKDLGEEAEWGIQAGAMAAQTRAVARGVKRSM